MNSGFAHSGRECRWQPWLASLGLAGLVFLAFGGSLTCGFVHYDDDLYVFQNPPVQGGLSWAGARWAFTTGHASNWHPLTWLSHMADVEWYGMAPAGHHLTSLLLHALNTILLFMVLHRLSGRQGLAWLTAALWAVHPLRTESVVWIAERKDVLAMFFGLLAMWTYGRDRSRGRMAWMALAYALSLLSKPTWVTLPLLLLLLDGWPLKRWPGTTVRKLVCEKWLLILLAAGSCVVTYLVQRQGGAVQTFERYPLEMRVANAGLAVVHYLRTLFWPVRLTFFYPHPGTSVDPVSAWGAFAVLLILTMLAAGLMRRQPWWLTGWLWFLGTLVPMIGLVQVGGQAQADRYTYLSHIGLILALVWGADQALGPGHRSRLRWLATAGAGGMILVLVLLSRRQTATWRDSETLFRHALAVQEANAVAHGNLGSWLATQGRADEARRHLERSLEIQPRFNEAHLNLGNLELQQGRSEEALAQYRAMEKDFPQHVQSLNNVAWLLSSAPGADPSRTQEALAYARRAVAASRTPGASLLDTLAVAFAANGDFPAAITTGMEARHQAAEEGNPGLIRAIDAHLADWRLKTTRKP